MHPAINREMAASRISDFRRQASRDATALTAARELRIQEAQRRQPLLARIMTRRAQHFLAVVVTRSLRAEDGTCVERRRHGMAAILLGRPDSWPWRREQAVEQICPAVRGFPSTTRPRPIREER